MVEKIKKSKFRNQKKSKRIRSKNLRKTKKIIMRGGAKIISKIIKALFIFIALLPPNYSPVYGLSRSNNNNNDNKLVLVDNAISTGEPVLLPTVEKFINNNNQTSTSFEEPFTTISMSDSSQIKTIIVLGDPHGVGIAPILHRANLTVSPIDCTWAGDNSTQLISVGDLVDRGSLVLEDLICMQKLVDTAPPGNAIQLTGNHELMFIEGNYNYAAKQDRSGPRNNEILNLIKNRIIDGDIKACFYTNGMLFSHAGINKEMLRNIKYLDKDIHSENFRKVVVKLVNYIESDGDGLVEPQYRNALRQWKVIKEKFPDIDFSKINEYKNYNEIKNLKFEIGGICLSEFLNNKLLNAFNTARHNNDGTVTFNREYKTNFINNNGPFWGRELHNQNQLEDFGVKGQVVGHTINDEGIPTIKGSFLYSDTGMIMGENRIGVTKIELNNNNEIKSINFVLQRGNNPSIDIKILTEQPISSSIWEQSFRF
jgi:hypothetical protein